MVDLYILYEKYLYYLKRRLANFREANSVAVETVAKHVSS